MTAADVQQEILEPMQRLWEPVRKMNEADRTAALREYVDALQGYGREVLREAWAKVRNEHTRSNWPPIAAFLAASRTAKRELPHQSEPFDPEKARGEWAVGFNRFCDHRGLSVHQRMVLLRPNMWWMFPRSEWKSDWKIEDIPKIYLDDARTLRAWPFHKNRINENWPEDQIDG